MDVRQLEYFVAVAEELSFTRAAARCHVVQSALSYQIARLERQTGVTLFERTSRTVRLAAGGEVLLPRARRILHEIAAARDDLSALTGVLTGTLRLGVVGSALAATPIVATALAEFHRNHPGVEIVVRDTGSARMAEDIRSGVLDVALVGLFGDQLPDDITHTVLLSEPLVAVVGPAHPAAGRDTVELAALASSGPFVEMRPESGLRRQVDAAFTRAGVERRIAVELSTSDSVLRFVDLGFGSAIVPRSAVGGRAGRVVPLTDPQARHPISLLHRSPRPTGPAAAAFVRYVHTVAGTVGPDAG